MTFPGLPLATDVDEVTARILDALVARLDGWVPRSGDPLVVLAEEIGREQAVLAQRQVQAMELAVADFGTSLFGVAPMPGDRAGLQVRLSLSAAGQVAPAGLQVVGITADGLEVGFELLEAAAPLGAGSTVDVVMSALEVGPVYNGVPAGELTLVTATQSVVSATALASSSGGLDPETLPMYLDRLRSYLGTLRPGGVLAADMAALARTIGGVHRALGLDNYNADTDTDGVERAVTVVPVTISGQPVDADTKAKLLALLESVREANLLVFVDAPTYTPVTVTYTAVAEPGFAAADVQASVRAAGLAYLNPATWGQVGSSPSWQPTNKVRLLDLARVLGSAPGVAYLSGLSINGGTADVTLPGRAPLPASATAPMPSTVSGTVS